MNEISELFDRDPLLLSDQDISKIVARIREAQVKFELGAPKAAPVKKSTKTQDLLKDLGLT